MGTQSQAGYSALQNTQGLKYGDFNVTQDWMFASNPLRGQGGANYVVFNPNDKTQKFAINDLGNLSEYLTLEGRKAEVQRPDYLKYGLSDAEDPTGRYENVFNTQTLEQIAEQKRQQDLVAQVQAGKITPDQATQQANQSSGFSNPANDVYNKAYNNPDTSQKPLNPNAIQSVEVQMPDGSIRRLDKNSDKYQEALKQGGNIISGTGTNADTSQMQGNQISQEQSQQIQQPVTIGPTLQQGARGSSVTQLQNALGITADGIFGPKTLQAVKNFQISKGLTPDGIVGPKTWSALSSGSNISPVGNFSSGASSNNQPSGGESDIPISTGNSTIDTLLGKLKDHAPQNNFASVYKEIYSDLGIDSIKEEYEKSSNEYSDLQDKKNDEKLEINNNPWFSEGRRVKELEKLDKKYEGKELILQNRIKLLESNISTARDDAQFIAGKTLEQAGQIDNFNQDIIMKAIDIAEKELESQNKSDTQVIEAGGRKLLIDAQTGSILKDFGSSGSGTGTGGLTPSQINTTVNSIAGAFDNEPIVKAYNTVQDGYQTLQTIGTQTKSPADDIAFIYAFAKIMDPNSVVREGEYNTIQKYAQTWADNFGFSAKRIFSNTNFLTSDAKQKMLNALSPKVQSITTLYNNVYSEYQRQIQDAYGGQPRSITDYSKPFSGSTTSNKISLDSPEWLNDYDYTRDLNWAKEAIQQGADKNIVKQKLQQKYLQVDL